MSCSKCVYAVYEEIPAFGHKYVNGACFFFGDQNNAPQYSDGLKYVSNGDGTCYVSGIGTCTDTDLKIPEISPDGDIVTSIGYNAFYRCASLTSVTIGDSVTSIAKNTFFDCNKLSSIIFKDISTWYRTEFEFEWLNRIDGIETDVTDSQANATYFSGNYYWYKE